MTSTTETYSRQFTTLFAELAMRTLVVSLSGAAILIASALLLLASQG